MLLKMPNVLSITAKQFIGWEHFAQIEPFTFYTELRADYRTAQIVAMLANINRGKGKKAYKVEDFLMQFDREVKDKQHPAEGHAAFFRALALAHSVPAKDVD